MARAYSLDLRKRVIAALQSGRSCRSVATTFNVSVASVVKWSQRFRATGSVAAKPMGGSRPQALADERTWILARIEANSDLTLRGLRAELAERGVVVSYGAVWNFVHREGLSFKKKRVGQRTGSARRRASPQAVEKISGPA